jgi:hypothetical protein
MSASEGESRVRAVLAGFREELRDIPAGDDLIDSRLINSLTFITIIQSLIDISGRDPDLDAVPIASLRTISGLTEIFFEPDVQCDKVPE